MLPLVTNPALCGGAQLAAFVLPTQDQPPLRSKCSSRGSAGACAGALMVMASGACCPPRSGRFQAQATRSRLRRRRRGSTGGGSDGDDDAHSRYGSEWSSFDVLHGLQLCYQGGGGNGGGGGSNGYGGGGGGWHHGQPAGGDAFHRALYDSMWLWQLLCAASLLQSWWFLLFPAAAGAVPVSAAGRAADVAQHISVAMAC